MYLFFPFFVSSERILVDLPFLEIVAGIAAGAQGMSLTVRRSPSCPLRNRQGAAPLYYLFVFYV